MRQKRQTWFYFVSFCYPVSHLDLKNFALSESLKEYALYFRTLGKSSVYCFIGFGEVIGTYLKRLVMKTYPQGLICRKGTEQT